MPQRMTDRLRSAGADWTSCEFGRRDHDVSRLFDIRITDLVMRHDTHHFTERHTDSETLLVSPIDKSFNIDFPRIPAGKMRFE